MTDADDTVERLQILLRKSELAAIDDFRFENRLPSRSSAIREILRRGLLYDGQEAVSEGSQSRDFGVLRQTRRAPKRGADVE
jgi:metal-responsive CopG/Arc/MetJ family transcriptional regulator